MIIGNVKKMTVYLEDGQAYDIIGSGVFERITTYIEDETKSLKGRTPSISYVATVKKASS